MNRSAASPAILINSETNWVARFLARKSRKSTYDSEIFRVPICLEPSGARMGTSHSASRFVGWPALSALENSCWRSSSTSALAMAPDCVNACRVASSEILSKFHRAMEIAAMFRETFLSESSCAARYRRSRSCQMVRAVTSETISAAAQITQKRIRIVSRDWPKSRMARLSRFRLRKSQEPRKHESAPQVAARPAGEAYLSAFGSYHSADLSRGVSGVWSGLV